MRKRKSKSDKLKNEDPSINFRLPEELKIDITREASLANKTVSNYLRDHLQSFVDGTLFEEIVQTRKTRFIESVEFLQLVTFVFAVRDKSDYKATNEQLTGHIETIKSIGYQLPEELKNEFDKVLMDLLKVRGEESSYRTFEFGKSFGGDFKYKKLEKFILKYLFDLKGDQVPSHFGAIRM